MKMILMSVEEGRVFMTIYCRPKVARSSVDFMVMLCYDWVMIESTEDRATAI